jgi:hypothetical protein
MQKMMYLLVSQHVSLVLQHGQVCVLLRAYTIPYILTHLLNQPPSNYPPPPPDIHLHDSRCTVTEN